MNMKAELQSLRAATEAHKEQRGEDHKTDLADLILARYEAGGWQHRARVPFNTLLSNHGAALWLANLMTRELTHE